MKLRNKKTGDVINTYYDSLEQFNEEWEDYEPVEPLIKDEKIRKAVRAWAEASGIDTTEIKASKGSIYTAIIGWKEHRFCGGLSIDFETPLLEELEDGKTYTITELCGEEEGCTPTEPLVEGRSQRAVLRAAARLADTDVATVLRSNAAGGVVIFDFSDKCRVELKDSGINVGDRGFYSLTQLCGEEGK